MSDIEEESTFNQDLESDDEAEIKQNDEEDDDIFHNDIDDIDEDEEVEEEEVDDDDDDDEDAKNTSNIMLMNQEEEDSVSNDSLSDIEDNEEEYDIDTHIDEESKMNFIKSIHPEEIHDSFDFMNKRANVIRKEVILKSNKDKGLFMINDPYHKTYPFLTKYEKARILGLRISQLNDGAKPLISFKNKIIDNHIIAEQELREKKLPFIISRPLPNGEKEYWRLEDLEVIER